MLIPPGTIKLTQYNRPFQRLFTGKLRLCSILALFAFTLIYLIKALQSSSSSSAVEMPANVYEYAEAIQSLKSDLQYAVVIDAGSSGSRVHIYCWPPHSGDARQLLQIKMLKDKFGKDVYSKINPGLSSCASNPSGAFDYIFPLLKFASEHIPIEKHRETPLFVLATAGMRMLPITKQEAILDNLKTNLPRNFSFAFSPNNVQVITGKEEGIYSWIAVNYLLGRFDHSIVSNSIVAINRGSRITTRPRTVGMLEMGGASMQIAFEIVSKYELEELKKKKADLKDTLAEFNLGCLSHDEDHDYLLYVTTYLGLGANVAHDSYHKLLLSDHLALMTSFNTLPRSNNYTILDPCMVYQSVKNVSISLNNTMYFLSLKGTGDWDGCETKLQRLLDPHVESGLQCSANVSCPLTKLKETSVTFSSSEFYGFSELWYSMEDILRIGGPYNYLALKKASKEFCSTSWDKVENRHKENLYPLADRERLMTQCFKSAWIAAVLHHGFKMPKSYKGYQSALTINSNQVQWTLGALIYRTRFFPLRAFEKYNSVVSERHLPPMSNYVNQVVFLLCMCAVIACIFIYLRHLHRMVNGSVAKTQKSSYLSEVKVEISPLITSRNV